MMKKLLLVTLLLPLLISCNDNNNEDYSTSVDSPDGFPRIAISTENQQAITSRDDYINGSAIVSGGDTFSSFTADMQIRGRGHSTWRQPKKPYQIRFNDKTSILGMAEDKKWILLTNYSDKSLLRNEVAFDLSRISLLAWTPDSRFTELVINGQYHGLYQLTQKVEESDNRVAIGDAGFLLEVDQLDRLDPDDVFLKTNHYLFNIKDPDLTYDDEKYLYIEDYIQTTENVLLGPDYLDPETGYRRYLDIDSFIDWYLINEIAKNQDAAFHSSVYMHLIPGEKLKMGPIWDFDIGFGNNKNPDTRVFDPEGFWVNRSRWFRRMFTDPVFVARLQERFDYFYTNRTLIYDKVNANAAYFNAAQVRNYERWPTLGKYVWPNPVYFDTYEEEVEHLLEWLELRFTWMNEAIHDL